MGAFFYFIFTRMGMVLKKTDKLLFELLRFALDTTGELQCFKEAPSDAQWKAIYELAKRQCVRGVAFSGIKKLPEDKRPARAMLLRWSLDAEAIAGKNKLMNQEAARLTQIFDGAGRKNAILKGQANARLYPDVLSRQAGDIDIWVEGGYKSVRNLLLEQKLMKEEVKTLARHHIDLPKSKDGIDVEVHYKPVSGIPFRNGSLQNFLNDEIRKAQIVPEGFYSPSIPFALVMQLAHLQQHFYSEGVGLRQYIDYLMLLRHSTENDRNAAVAIMKRLSMMRVCGAVMWLLQQVFGLKRDLMLYEPDRWRGERLLKLALMDGNFGQYKVVPKPKNVFVRWFKDRMRALSWVPFDPLNAGLVELKYWRITISLIPKRIKRRRIAL